MSLTCILMRVIIVFAYLCEAAVSIEIDEQALSYFKAKISDDPLGVMLSWNSSVQFCQWHGVTCSNRHKRVIMLDLSSSFLVGSISPHIGNLSFLRVLNLQNNSLSQDIPAEIGRLRRLEELMLNNNSIGGQIPSNISRCANLVFINIARNKLEGIIPEELGSLSKMEAFGANNNRLTGSIPFSFGNLSSLVKIFLNTNFFDGSIPESLGRLTNLTDFWVGGNGLSGDIPLSLFNLSSLINFNVVVNRIQGFFPSNIGITLPNIRHFSISVNRITGTIPLSIANASNLEILLISDNQLIGEVPSLENLHRLQHISITKNLLGNSLSFLCSLRNATNLRSLSINFNKFEGILPECIGNLSGTVAVLAVDNNRLFGSIPAAIGNLVNLQRLDMWNNQLSGDIDFIGKLHNLVYLQLQYNRISGEIPNSLGNLTKLTFLNLRKNNLHGSIPSSLGNCRTLQELALSSNNFNGSITPQVFLISSLFLLELSDNHFTGGVPSEIGNLKNLGKLLVHANMLSGEIPTALGSCTSLEMLYLQGNSFQGPIPSSLHSLRGLEILDISHNNLSGQIPEFLATFSFLINLNLSFNDFEGMVPTEGAFKNSSATSLVGNTKLCGGMPEFHLPSCRLERRRLLVIITCSVIGFLSAVSVVALLFFVRLRKRTRSSPSSLFPNSLLQASYQDLCDATDGFSSSKLIGAGSFGSVYKGILRESGAVIAVKVVNLQHHKAAKSFMAECEALRNIRHRNLVKVLTVCSSIDSQGNEFKALVYEFMANGSLDEWLHPLPRVDDTQNKLNLLQRLNIAIDIASALEYLHHHCRTPVVHCDLKPSNILLNDELVGHIGDFGIAKFISDSFSSHQSSTIGLRGTIGYAPPEYGLGAEVSKQGDVYSYGILLLEMFTGKRPTHDMFKEGLCLHEFAKSAFPDRVVDISDPILLHELRRRANNTPSSSSIEHNSVTECLISVVRIGVASSVEAPGERMNIKDVTMNV